MKIGPYEVLGEIGRGGVGAVYKAQSPEHGVVAVKVLLDPDPDAVARFGREERLQKLFTEAQGFVTLLASGTTAEGPFLVMPFLPGGTLKDRLRIGPLGIGETVELGRALARAVGTAHRAGVVHRDLKPANVLFDGDGRPLVSDLGLAKRLRRDALDQERSASLSQTGQIAGTHGYLAPEQVDDSKHVGPEADVFALGAILYECLAGTRAIGGLMALAQHAATPGGMVRPLAESRKDVPPDLAAIVHRALAPRPEDRFADGLALLEALDACARPRGSRKSWLVAAAIVALVSAGVAAARSRGVTPHENPAAVTSAASPPRLRGGRLARLPDGTEIRIYLLRLPGGADDMELVHVPGGEFTMGADETDTDSWSDERPRHRQAMDHEYWIGRTCVTRAQYGAFCRATGHAVPGSLPWLGQLDAPGEHPVVSVRWSDAVAFCDWAGAALPTEAEWEKAARGTDGRKFPWGDEWDPPRRCNYLDKSCPDVGQNLEIWGSHDGENDDGFPYTSPVGAFPGGASPYGALDMAGNVFQWCADEWDRDRYRRWASGDMDPASHDAEKNMRSMRGGSWAHQRRVCRSSGRPGSQVWAASPTVGFRVVVRP